MYDGLAEVYDLLMEDVDTDGWFSFYMRLLERGFGGGSRGLSRLRACDAACGTGAMALRMAEVFCDVLAVDQSPAMLRAAQEKARRQGRAVRFAQQDIAKLTLPSPVDVLLCANDGVNYLESPARARAFFRRAAEALTPGGVLAFDVSSPHKLRNVLGDNLSVEDRREVAYIWRNRWNESMRLVQMELTFFLRDPDGRYRRCEETHVQRAHEEGELRAWLEDAGFDAEIFGERVLRQPMDNDMRWFALARKRGEEND